MKRFPKEVGQYKGPIEINMQILGTMRSTPRVFLHNLRFDQAARTPRQYEVRCVCFWLVTGWWEWGLVDFWSVDWLIGWWIDFVYLFWIDYISYDNYWSLLLLIDWLTQDILRKHSRVYGCIFPMVHHYCQTCKVWQWECMDRVLDQGIISLALAEHAAKTIEKRRAGK